MGKRALSVAVQPGAACVLLVWCKRDLCSVGDRYREHHLQDVRAAAADDHLDATLVERLRQGLADAGAAAGDVRHLRGESHGLTVSRFWIE